MWLLKLRVAFSVLCFITIVGFRNVCKQTLTDNGWTIKEKGKNDVKLFAHCLVPLMNAMMVITIFIMVYMKKSEVDEILESQERR